MGPAILHSTNRFAYCESHSASSSADSGPERESTRHSMGLTIATSFYIVPECQDQLGTIMRTILLHLQDSAKMNTGNRIVTFQTVSMPFPFSNACGLRRLAYLHNFQQMYKEC